MLVTGANPALTNPNSSEGRRGALGARPARGARPVHDRDGRRGGLRAAGGLVPRAHRAARPSRDRGGHADPPGRLGWPEVQGEYEFWRDLARRLGAATTSPGRTRRELNRWLLEPTGLTLEELEAHPEGVAYGPPPADAEIERLRDAVRQGRVRVGVPGGPGLRRAAGVPAGPPTSRRRTREYPFVLITGARKLLFLHSRFRNIPRFADGSPRRPVWRCTPTTPPLSAWPTATRCA